MKNNLKRITIIAFIILFGSPAIINAQQTVKERVNAIKKTTVQLAKDLQCFKNPEACSPAQIRRINATIQAIKYQIMPLGPSYMPATHTPFFQVRKQLSTPTLSLVRALAQLEMYIRHARQRGLTHAQKQELLSAAKKASIIAGTLAAVAIVIGASVLIPAQKKKSLAIIIEEIKSKEGIDKDLIEAVEKQDIKTIKNIGLAEASDYPSLSALTIAKQYITDEWKPTNRKHALDIIEQLIKIKKATEQPLINEFNNDKNNV